MFFSRMKGGIFWDHDIDRHFEDYERDFKIARTICIVVFLIIFFLMIGFGALAYYLDSLKKRSIVREFQEIDDSVRWGQNWNPSQTR